MFYSKLADSMLINRTHVPIYPLIANQIIRKFNITEGTAIDVGAGPASLSIAMARITHLDIYAMDISREMLEIAQKSIEKNSLKKRITLITGDVNQMPFQDEFAELIFSRGSMFFWKDLPTSFKEIYRVLKPGGAGYIGGFGSAALRRKVKEEFKRKDGKSYQNPPKIQVDALEIAVLEAGIADYLLINDESGLWVLFEKTG